MTTEDDRTRLAQALTTIRDAWPAMLPTTPRQITTGTIGRTPETPLPVPAHVLEVRRVALVRLSGWAQVVMDDQDLHPQLLGTDAVAMCEFLSIHADYLATLGDEPLDELTETARDCERIVAPNHTEAEYVGPCRACGFDLRRRYGATTVVCQNCGEDENADERRAFLIDSISDRLMYPSEMARAVPGIADCEINPTTLRKWKERGRIVAHGKDAQGRDLFRVSEVLDLVKEAQRRSA